MVLLSRRLRGLPITSWFKHCTLWSFRRQSFFICRGLQFVSWWFRTILSNRWEHFLLWRDRNKLRFWFWKNFICWWVKEWSPVGFYWRVRSSGWFLCSMIVFLWKSTQTILLALFKLGCRSSEVLWMLIYRFELSPKRSKFFIAKIAMVHCLFLLKLLPKYLCFDFLVAFMNLNEWFLVIVRFFDWIWRQTGGFR